MNHYTTIVHVLEHLHRRIAQLECNLGAHDERQIAWTFDTITGAIKTHRQILFGVHNTAEMIIQRYVTLREIARDIHRRIIDLDLTGDDWVRETNKRYNTDNVISNTVKLIMRNSLIQANKIEMSNMGLGDEESYIHVKTMCDIQTPDMSIKMNRVFNLIIQSKDEHHGDLEQNRGEVMQIINSLKRNVHAVPEISTDMWINETLFRYPEREVENSSLVRRIIRGILTETGKIGAADTRLNF